ncbi:hypothetical protein [Bacteriophage sp.]|nr:hypothetical protein [Caudoviricetes sp.]UOF80019.1 hypothetical protein [Bacteriophage sp.]
MTEALKFVPPRVAITDPRTGLISREWYLFFQGVFNRIGGATGPSTTDVSSSLFEDAGSGETNAMLFTLENELKQTPQYEQYVSEALTIELNGLRELVAELTKEVEAIKQATSL